MNYALKKILYLLYSHLNPSDGFVLAEFFEDVEDVGAFAGAAEEETDGR